MKTKICSMIPPPASPSPASRAQCGEGYGAEGEWWAWGGGCWAFPSPSPQLALIEGDLKGSRTDRCPEELGEHKDTPNLGIKSKGKSLAGAIWQWQVGHGKVDCPTHGRSGYTSQGPEADPEEGSWAGAFCQGPTQPQRAVWRDWGTVAERLCKEGLEMVPPR